MPLMTYAISNIFQKRYAYADTESKKKKVLDDSKQIMLFSSLILVIPGIILLSLFFPDQFSKGDLITLSLATFLVAVIELRAAQLRVDKNEQIISLFLKRIVFEHILRIPLIIYLCDTQTELYLLILISIIPTALTEIDKQYLPNRNSVNTEIIRKNFSIFIASVAGVIVMFFDKVLLVSYVDSITLATLFICTRFANAISVLFTKTYSLHLQGTVYNSVKILRQDEIESFFRGLYKQNYNYSLIATISIYLLSIIALFYFEKYQIFTMSSNYSSLLFASCISAFLFSLNFTASYLLTSQERFNVYALLNVTSLFTIAIFTNLFIPKISGTIYLMILIVLPAYINFMLLNVGVVLIYYRYHLRNILIANLLLMSLFILNIYFLNG